MEKIKIVQEAFEKAKELYWENNKAISISIEAWKHSTGDEETIFRLWVDEGLGKSATHIFESESFEELLDFLGIESKIDLGGDPRPINEIKDQEQEWYGDPQCLDPE